MKRDPLVSYLVLTMNRVSELETCLKSITRQTSDRYEIVVVDNASSDETPQMVEDRFPDIVYKRLTENVGAANGRNEAFATARGAICVLIDDDAELMDAQATEKIARYFEEDQNLGILALNVVNAHTSNVDLKCLPRRDKQVQHQDFVCTYFCGAGAAIRKKAFDKAGGFWGKLFIYVEELDLSYRILDLGYRAKYSTTVDVLHRETLRARPSTRHTRSMVRNRIWVALRNLPFPYVLIFPLAWIAKMGWSSLRQGQFHAFLCGITEAVAGIRVALRIRRPLKASTVKILRENSGRLWY